jgi:hypothetical protein
MCVVCGQDGIEFSVSDSALSRSRLLYEIHSVDREGRAELQCDSRTWEAADDPTSINDVKRLHDVVEVSTTLFKASARNLGPI